MGPIAPRNYVAQDVFEQEMAALETCTWQLVGLVGDSRPGTARHEQTIGCFVFATDAASPPALLDYLGPYADYLRAVSRQSGEVILRDRTVVEANWKLVVEVSLDDYHLVATHPTTFGVEGAIEAYKFVYRRDGLHSCYLKRRDADWSFDSFWRDLPAGEADRTGYKIFQIFPMAFVAGMHEVLFGSFATPIDSTHTLVDSFAATWADRPRIGVERANLIEYVRTFLREDREACEAWQTTVGQLSREPTLGRLEERVRWFHETYASTIGPSREAAE